MGINFVDCLKYKLWQIAQTIKAQKLSFIIFLIFLIFCTSSLIMYFYFPNFEQYIKEFLNWGINGMLLELFLITFILTKYQEYLDDKNTKDTLQRTIYNLIDLDTIEAKSQTAGCIKQLNKYNITAINFVGAKISDFSFRHYDIASLEGSSFYQGSWGNLSRRDNCSLLKVKFTRVNLKNVCFSKFNPFVGFQLSPPAQIIDCDFSYSNLQNAKFCGAEIKYCTKPDDDLYEEMVSPFDSADLSKTDFTGVKFTNVDFRKANNIKEAIFKDCEGLNTCNFDDDDKEWFIKNDYFIKKKVTKNG